MPTFDQAEKMGELLNRIGGSLIQATPEWWSDATLRVDVHRSTENTSLEHAIHSEQHPADVVVATDEIFAATRELQLLADGTGEPWTALIMSVRQVDGDWKFKVNFEYAD